MGRLIHKTALITGASRGIGAAIAEQFIQEGATVVLTDCLISEGELLASHLGPNAFFHWHDVASESSWAALSQWVQEQSYSIDIVVNNAGVIGLEESTPQDPEHLSLSSWRRIHEINLDSVFLGCQYAIRWMKQKGGSIINLSSRSGMVGIPLACAYASTKAAIRNHTKSVALYCAQNHYAIRCNSIHPGAILTPLWEHMLGNDPTERSAMIQKISSGIPLGHMGQPIDVAHLAVYLASNESAYMTGSELTLDGGILAGSAAAPMSQTD